MKHLTNSSAKSSFSLPLFMWNLQIKFVYCIIFLLVNNLLKIRELILMYAVFKFSLSLKMYMYAYMPLEM